VFRRSAILLGLPVLIVVAVALPLGLLLGSYQWLCSGIAIGLTVPAGLLTFLAGQRMNKASQYGPVVSLFFGTFVRILIGFGGGLIVFIASGSTFRAEPMVYWLWLMGAYLATLLTETAVLIGR
jgi:hypothetical protein